MKKLGIFVVRLLGLALIILAVSSYWFQIPISETKVWASIQAGFGVLLVLSGEARLIGLMERILESHLKAK